MNRQMKCSWRPFALSLGIAWLLLAVVWLSLAAPVRAQAGGETDAAALITVNTLNTGIAADGKCSLIEAIENAQADAAVHADCLAGTGADTIALQADALYYLTTVNNMVDGPNGLPSITGTLTILGNGAAIIRNTTVSPPEFRLFHVAAGGRLILENVHLRNGRVDPSGTNTILFGGGAILNRGSLTVRGGSVSYNRAGWGGAIYQAAVSETLAITGTVFSYNTAETAGGAIYSHGPTVLANVTVQNNMAASAGGGILHTAAEFAIFASTIRLNQAEQGGGLAVYASDAPGRATVEGTTFISNTAVLAGGGLLNAGANGYTATTTVDTSVFRLNVVTGVAADEGWGGGLVNGFVLGSEPGAAHLTVLRTTVGENVAKLGGGIASLDAAGYVTRSVTLSVTQSALAGNVAQGTGPGAGTGGGLYVANSQATLFNSTVGQNLAQGDDVALSGRGGGIAVATQGISTTLTAINATVAQNKATTGGGGIASLAVVTGTEATVSLGNTLIQYNKLAAASPISDIDEISDTTSLADLVSAAVTAIISDTQGCLAEDGTIASLGDNVESGDTCGLTATGDLSDEPVDLQPLGDHGGPTPTYVPFQLTAAFNAGNNDLCAVAGNVDQRGIIRPQGPACDIGAVEVVPGLGHIYFPRIVLRYTPAE